MNEQEHKGPGEADQDGRARHGYRNEVSWDNGQGRQPYANQGTQEQGPAAAHGAQGGSRGDASGRTIEQLEALKEKPERPEDGAPRET